MLQLKVKQIATLMQIQMRKPASDFLHNKTIFCLLPQILIIPQIKTNQKIA